MIAFIGDPHFHNFTDFAEPSTRYEGLNTRAEGQLDAMYTIFANCVEREISTVVFCGDMFHRKNMIYVPLFNAVRKLLMEGANEFGLRILIVPGNHDVVNRAGKNTSVEALDDIEGISICDSALVIAEGVRLHCIGWGEEIQFLTERKTKNNHTDILVTHAMVEGATFDNDFPVEDGIDFKNVMKKFDYAVVGHIHKWQILQNNHVLIPGSPYALNRGERGIKGYWIYHKELPWELVEVPSPKFHTLNFHEAMDDELTCEDNENFITVEVPKNARANQIKVLKKKFKHLELVLIGEKTIEKKRTKIKLTDPVETLMEKYVSEVPTKGMNKKQLLNYGIKLIRSA